MRFPIKIISLMEYEDDMEYIDHLVCQLKEKCSEVANQDTHIANIEYRMKAAEIAADSFYAELSAYKVGVPVALLIGCAIGYWVR